MIRKTAVIVVYAVSTYVSLTLLALVFLPLRMPHLPAGPPMIYQPDTVLPAFADVFGMGGTSHCNGGKVWIEDRLVCNVPPGRLLLDACPDLPNILVRPSTEAHDTWRYDTGMRFLNVYRTDTSCFYIRRNGGIRHHSQAEVVLETSDSPSNR